MRIGRRAMRTPDVFPILLNGKDPQKSLSTRNEGRNYRKHFSSRNLRQSSVVRVMISQWRHSEFEWKSKLQLGKEEDIRNAGGLVSKLCYNFNSDPPKWEHVQVMIISVFCAVITEEIPESQSLIKKKGKSNNEDVLYQSLNKRVNML